MSDAKIKIVDGEEWVGLYIDGECVYQNHDIPIYRLLDYLDVDYEQVSLCDHPNDEHGDLDEWLCNYGYLPKYFKDIPFEK